MIESKTIEQIASEQKEIARNQTTFNHNVKAYLNKNPIPSLTTPLGNSSRAYNENRTVPNIQTTIVHLKQATGTGKIDQNQLPIVNLNNCMNVPRYR